MSNMKPESIEEYVDSFLWAIFGSQFFPHRAKDECEEKYAVQRAAVLNLYNDNKLKDEVVLLFGRIYQNAYKDSQTAQIVENYMGKELYPTRHLYKPGPKDLDDWEQAKHHLCGNDIYREQLRKELTDLFKHRFAIPREKRTPSSYNFSEFSSKSGEQPPPPKQPAISAEPKASFPAVTPNRETMQVKPQDTARDPLTSEAKIAGEFPAVAAASKVSVQPAKQDEPAAEKPSQVPGEKLDESAAASALGAWKYVPLPENLPDPHTEYEADTKDAPGELKIIAARVRGKKHKHDGTHCDDWYETDICGAWTIIAVSDGAGSHKFSRVGAEVSCKAAVSYLREALSNHSFASRDVWNFNRDRMWQFADPDIEFCQMSLHTAMRKAYDAVAQAAADRAARPEYEKILGRPLELRDLSATLLLAIHQNVPFSGREYSFLMTTHVGDGFIVSIDEKGECKDLAVPDSGEFSSETEFLTSKKKLEPLNLRQKTFPHFLRLRTLLVMTDGVADDYFPPKPQMARLYGDLFLNGILRLDKLEKDKIPLALRATNLAHKKQWEEEVARWEYSADCERILAENLRPKVKVRSAEMYAEQLGLGLDKLLNAPEWLQAGFLGNSSWLLDNPLSAESRPEERLKIWLDSYYRRGSFDDRTLVALHREGM